jgi:hypothetical protein
VSPTAVVEVRLQGDGLRCAFGSCVEADGHVFVDAQAPESDFAPGFLVLQVDQIVCRAAVSRA